MGGNVYESFEDNYNHNIGWYFKPVYKGKWVRISAFIKYSNQPTYDATFLLD